MRPGRRPGPAHPAPVNTADATGALLNSFGWAVVRAADAEIALQMLDSEEVAPDVVLADVAMSGEFDGAELAVHSRRTRPALRIVLMTGRITEVARAFGDGFRLPPTPCSPTELVAAPGAPDRGSPFSARRIRTATPTSRAARPDPSG